MEFNKQIEELLAKIREFLDIHANPYDTSKHNETAEKLAKLAAALTAKEAVPAAENKTVASSTKLASSVGKGGKNEKATVVLVQNLLNKNGANLVPDGACGPKTIGAIEKFQQSKNIKITGLVEPDSETFKALTGEAIPVINKPQDPTPKKEEPVKKEEPTNTETSNSYTLSSSVGKGGKNEKNAVMLVQSLLNRHGAKIGVDGDCGAKSVAAIEKFQESKTIAVTGLVEPDSDTFKALLAPPATVVAGEEEITTKLGATGKLGNTIINQGGYVISLPPNASGAYPMVMLFSGLNQNATTLLGEVPDIYYLKAIMVFSGPSGSFGAAKTIFDPILVAKGLSATSVSICGFSLGGQAAFKNYSHATKAVGLMDPTTYYKDIAKIDSKAVFVAKTKNGKNIAGGWDWDGGKGVPGYTCQHARAEALDTAAAKGGVGEEVSMAHGKFPKYVLSKYKSRFI